VTSLLARCVLVGRKLANSRIALWILGAAVLLVLTALTGISAVDSLLGSMHASGDVSAGLQSGLFRSPDDIAAVVQGWSNFADADTSGQYWSALALGLVSLLLDTLVLVPGYLLAGTILLLRGAQWNAGLRATLPQAARRAQQLTRSDDPHPPALNPQQQAGLDAAMFMRRLHWAYLALIMLAVVDVVENLLSAGVLLGFWPSTRGLPVAPPGWATASSRALFGVTVLKWLLALWVVTELVLLAVRYLNARWTPAIATLRLLRAQIVIVAFLLLVLQLPVQVPDAVLRLEVGHFVGVAVVAVGLATLQWAICRHLLVRAADDKSRDHNPTQPAPRWWWYAGFGVCLLLVALVAVQVAAADAHPGDLVREVASGPGVLLGLLVVVAAGTWLSRDRPQRRLVGDDPDPVLGRRALPRLLGVGVLVAVGLAIVRYSITALAYRNNAAEWPRLAGGVGLVLLALGVAIVFWWLDGRLATQEGATSSWWRGPHLGVAAVFLLITVVWAAAMVRFWATWPVYVGAIGVVLVFLAAVSAVAAVLVGASEWASTRYKPPSLFRAIGLRRWPVFTLLLIWFVAGARFDSGVHWEVRRLEDVPAPQARLTLAQAWQGWREVHAGSTVSPGADRPAVPLVVVAAAGGGIRAATWTALAMRCLFEGQPAVRNGTATACAVGSPTPPPSGNILLASGISGSSLGLAAFSAHLNASNDTAADWVDRLKGDYVSSQLAWQLLVETPRSLLHFRTQDRAEVLERSWEHGWDGVQASGGGNPLAQGLLATQLAADRARRVPLLLLNGDSVYDGCWLLSSALDEGLRSYPDPADPTTKALERPVDCHNLDPYTANRRLRDRPNQPPLRFLPAGSLPGVVDVADFLCSTKDGRASQDLRLSTAALLSARFPEVSPAGRLQFCDTRRDGSPPRNKFVLDGGIIEGSASEAALAAWEQLRPLIEAHNAAANTPCVVPFFVQLDNDYLVSSSETSPRPPNQLQAPLQAQSAAGTGSRAQRIRQATALAFTSPTIGSVQVKGPDGTPLSNRYERLVPLGHPGPQASLGWALSTQTQTDLENQLHQENRNGVETIRQWLTAKLTCTQVPS
jgi:hypothetical protein